MESNTESAATWNTLDCLPGMSRTWRVPDESSSQNADLLIPEKHRDPKRCVSEQRVYL